MGCLNGGLAAIYSIGLLASISVGYVPTFYYDTDLNPDGYLFFGGKTNRKTRVFFLLFISLWVLACILDILSSWIYRDSGHLYRPLIQFERFVSAFLGIIIGFSLVLAPKGALQAILSIIPVSITRNLSVNYGRFSWVIIRIWGFIFFSVGLYTLIKVISEGARTF